MPEGIPKYLRVYDNGGGDNYFCRPCLTFQDEPRAPGQCPECGGKLLPVTGGSFDRYTVVFSGRYKKPGEWFQYLAMNARPCHPQGFGQHGHTDNQPCDCRPGSGWPPPVGGKSHWGSRRITWAQLPQACQKLVLSDYKAIWDI